MVVTDKISKSLCTGCFGCVNACPVDAINMEEGKDGFLYPVVDKGKCINCEKCLNFCPKFSFVKENWNEPIVFAAYANDDIREVSSSGGIFSVLANCIIEKKGVIAGAAYDQDMQVKHILIDKKKNLGLLRGSKYVQSNIGDIYRKIEEVLKNKRTVLFSGCPCQVAALKNYLKRDYENLLLVDILCHGVPSNKTFQEYLDSIRDNRIVENVDFRNKKFGWNCSTNLVQFKDGSFYIGNYNRDCYVKGFLQNLFLRESCEKCEFCKFPRVGDISLGDFWGIRDIDSTMYDKLGTSIVFINNKKGQKYFEAIKTTLMREKQMSFEPEKYPNRIHAFYQHHAKRKQYFDLIDGKGFNSTVNYLLPEKGTPIYQKISESTDILNNKIQKYDVGLVCNYFAENFGGSLTQYALYNVLKKMGYSVLMIEHPLECQSITSKEKMNNIYIEIPYPSKDMAPTYKTRQEMYELNQVCDNFVVGSDQLFQYSLYQIMGKMVSLDWVEDSKRKIAYAASFGHGHIWGEEKELQEMKYFLQKYDGFSVREDQAVEICRKEFEIDAEWVLDPVFLCDRECFIELANKAKVKWSKPFIGAYLLDPSTEKKKMIEKLKIDLGMECDIFSEFNASSNYMKPIEPLSWHNYKIEERLANIINCDFFITDSFHATCFCIIMKKPFITIMNSKRGANRFESLLGYFGLKDRLIKNYEDLEKIEEIWNIDFEHVHDILNKDKHRSMMWLKNQLRKPKKVVIDEYNLLYKKIYEQNQEMNQLRKIVEKLSYELGYGIEKIENIHEYLRVLFKNRKRYIVCLSVKDTTGFLLDEQIANEINKLGLKTKLVNQHWHSYLGILDEDKVIYEMLSELDEPVSKECLIEEIQISVESRCLHAGNEAVICINGKNYAINRRGLNFVIYDKEEKCVVDSVCFDTHAKGIPSYR